METNNKKTSTTKSNKKKAMIWKGQGEEEMRWNYLGNESIKVNAVVHKSNGSYSVILSLYGVYTNDIPPWSSNATSVRMPASLLYNKYKQTMATPSIDRRATIEKIHRH